MKLTVYITCLLLISYHAMEAQKEPHHLPYQQIPEAPESYTDGNVVARMVDGLGFRYYWATEGLRPDDLSYKPSSEARTAGETLDHILGLSLVVLNSAEHKINEGIDASSMDFDQKRKMTLENLKKAGDIFRKSEDLSQFSIIFKGENGNREFPFWNQINGPISDALWHCGQIVSFRRASGNPMNPKVSVFTGKLRD
jgi:hypothetical protein